MMVAMDARNMYSNLAVNKYLHTVASCWISSAYLKIKYHLRDLGTDGNMLL